MSGFKRERNGNVKTFDGPKPAQKPVAVSAYTAMFETFRDELDEHHDRRERIVKASRDITALSKKMIFALQRVRKIDANLPPNILKEIDQRLGEISKLLAAVAVETQGINRYRYYRSLACLEELVEALTFVHYLRTQQLISFDELLPSVLALARQGTALEDTVMNDAGSGEDTVTPANERTEDLPAVSITEDDYLFGVFDLTGEMMRFATTTSALTGSMAARGEDGSSRTIVKDMQDLGSFFEMLPRRYDKSWTQKMDTLQQSVRKVERLGYDRTVRGTERPAGWVPDLTAGDGQRPGTPE